MSAFERITDLALDCAVTYILGTGKTVTNTKIRLQIQSDRSPLGTGGPGSPQQSPSKVKLHT